jgi:AhpD family alkylhydroperoxidase
MALTEQERELVAVATSVAAGCRPCTTYHLEKASAVGVTEAEVRRAVERAGSVGRSASESMRRHALADAGGDGGIPSPEAGGDPTRIGELVSIGAAFAVSSTSGLEKHLEQAAELGVGDADVREVVELAAFIRNQAASHAARLAGLDGTAGEPPASQRPGRGCC